MDKRSSLHVIYSDGGVETNYTKEAADFKRDTFDVQMTTDDFIYIGHEKLINALYVQMEAFNTVGSSFTLEYYTASGWSVVEVWDETMVFMRNGFLTWDRPTDAAEITVGGITACWYRLSVNDDIDNVSFQAINLLFSDDNTICAYEPGLDDACFFPEGETSHILRHLAAKNYIMSKIRRKYTAEVDGSVRNVTEWDVLDIYELREAANYYAISQIYFNLAEGPEDQYWAKYVQYKEMFDEAFSLGLLTIDQNGDGQANSFEKQPIKMTRLVR